LLIGKAKDRNYDGSRWENYGFYRQCQDNKTLLWFHSQKTLNNSPRELSPQNNFNLALAFVYLFSFAGEVSTGTALRLAAACEMNLVSFFVVSPAIVRE